MPALVIFGGIALVALHQCAGLNREAAVFPRAIAIAMAVFVAAAVFRLFVTRHVAQTAVEGSRLRMAALPAAMLSAVLLMPVLGFLATAVFLGLFLSLVAQHDRFSAKGWASL